MPTGPAAERGFRRVDERTVHAGAVISTAVATFEAPDGTTFERDVVRHPGAVSVVPLVTGGGGGDEVVLVRQYRAAIDGWLLEIPAGKRDVADEPPELTASRELVDEGGLEPVGRVTLAQFQTPPQLFATPTAIALAVDPVPAVASAHSLEEEYLTVERVPLDELAAMIAAGEITDATTSIERTRHELRRVG